MVQQLFQNKRGDTKLLIVQKYGGSSVANAERIFNVAKRIIEAYDEGNDMVVVLSAQGDTTDELIEKAAEINPNASRREMDMLLSTGEQQSVALMAMAINALGRNAISLNAFQVGIDTNSNYSNARIKTISTERINLELEKKNIVIVTGFQGVNKYDDVTTLGRGGSDTSAVALAAKLHADICEIYTDVDGVYTADPRVVKSAMKLDEISYDEMLELASLGAKVLHNRSVELAKKYNVKLVVRSSLTRAEGTVVKEETNVERMLISGVASDKDVSRISVIGIEDVPGKAFALFSLLAKEKISVDIILQSIGRDNTKDISFTVAKSDLQRTLDVLEANKERLGVKEITHKDNIAKLSVVGAGMATNPGVASLMFEALYDAGVNINMISTSEIKISVLIDEKDVDDAMVAVHDKFKDATKNFRN
ncbi:MAG TPA: aspartate kinase [Candidatus Fimicola cottocaccae]|nr:aspartate kinase [Candidatus Fimicola cottocaccae]